MFNQLDNPDYELEEVVEVGRPEQFRAFGDATRQKILGLLSERAATTSQLAEALGQPKGSVAYHIKVLEGAELIRVVKTRKVRAITEKHYGKVARLYRFVDSEGSISAEPFAFFRQAMAEYAQPSAEDQPAIRSVIRHARMPYSQAEAFFDRIAELAQEFAESEKVSGERVYGLVAAVYLTDWPELRGEDENNEGGG